MGVGEGVAVRGTKLGFSVAVRVEGGFVAVALGSAVVVKVEVVAAAIGMAVFVISKGMLEQLDKPPAMTLIKRNRVPCAILNLSFTLPHP